MLIMTQRLICKRCEWTWNYKGKKEPNKNYPQYTTCPRCHSLVKIKYEETIEEEIRKEKIREKELRKETVYGL